MTSRIASTPPPREESTCAKSRKLETKASWSWRNQRYCDRVWGKRRFTFVRSGWSYENCMDLDSFAWRFGNDYWRNFSVKFFAKISCTPLICAWCRVGKCLIAINLLRWAHAVSSFNVTISESYKETNCSDLRKYVHSPGKYVGMENIGENEFRNLLKIKTK